MVARLYALVVVDTEHLCKPPRVLPSMAEATWPIQIPNVSATLIRNAKYCRGLWPGRLAALGLACTAEGRLWPASNCLVGFASAAVPLQLVGYSQDCCFRWDRISSQTASRTGRPVPSSRGSSTGSCWGCHRSLPVTIVRW